jgi:hypothetical protein
VKAGLEAQVGGWLAGRGRVDLSGLRLTALSVDLSEGRIGLRGQAQGQVQVLLE